MQMQRSFLMDCHRRSRSTGAEQINVNLGNIFLFALPCATAAAVHAGTIELENDKQLAMLGLGCKRDRQASERTEPVTGCTPLAFVSAEAPPPRVLLSIDTLPHH